MTGGSSSSLLTHHVGLSDEKFNAEDIKQPCFRRIKKQQTYPPPPDHLPACLSRAKKLTFTSISLKREQETNMAEANTCGCGRSPTGKCCGWHNLSEEQYAEKKAQWEARQAEKKAS